MDQQFADAHPRKRFFLEMFTRDIALEDTVLDLIDNSIDALTRSRNLDISPALLTQPLPSALQRSPTPLIRCRSDKDSFVVSDNCGGIPTELAMKELFTFGHSEAYAGSQLGVYGVGLKRALFKIGRHFTVESRTPKEGFVATLDVADWSKKDERPEDWKIPLAIIPGAGSLEKSGTTITIRSLTDEVRARFSDPTLAHELHSAISKTYLLFLGRVVNVHIERTRVAPWSVPIAESKEIRPAHRDYSTKYKEGTVATKIISSLAMRGSKNEWTYDRAGWYVFCNNRAVLTADKSELTGWGVTGLPRYHSKYNGFIGLIFFQSSNPALLPWKTRSAALIPIPWSIKRCDQKCLRWRGLSSHSLMRCIRVTYRRNFRSGQLRRGSAQLTCANLPDEPNVILMSSHAPEGAHRVRP